MNLRKVCFFVFIALAATSASVLPQHPPRDATGAAQQKGSAEFLLNQGRELVEARRYDQAITSLTEAIRLKPELILAYQSLTMAYLGMGHLQRAQETAHKAVEINPNDANSHLAVAQVQLALQQVTEAIETYKKITHLSPESSTGFYDLGTIYLQAGKPQEAAATLQQSLRLNPQWVGAHLNLAIAYLQLGRDDEGIAQLKEALRVAPGAYFAAERLARESIRLGRFNDALQGYESLSRAPMQREGCDSIAFAKFYLGQGEEAAQVAQNCLQMRGWQDSAAPYVVLFEYLGWRRAGNQKMANAALTELQAQLTPSKWPFPIVRYLRREISADELLKQAGNNDQQTEARAYLGCDLVLNAKSEEALLHLRWVKASGNRSFIEYPLAVLELHRLEKAATKSEK
jgi:tetratricopeptide (TPR) repeat protein